MSRTGEPYRVPKIPMYTSQLRTLSAHTCVAGWSAAGKSAISTITCPAAETARSASAAYEIPPAGKFRSSDVCDRNTRHVAPLPGLSEPATRLTPGGFLPRHQPIDPGSRMPALDAMVPNQTAARL